MLPVSLTFAFLLRNDKNRSPSWDIIDIKKETKIISLIVIKSLKIIQDKKIDKKKDPNMPVYVLFGLIFVIFFPFNIFPKVYPPISEDIHTVKINKKYKRYISFDKINGVNAEIKNIIKYKLKLNNIKKNIILDLFL